MGKPSISVNTSSLRFTIRRIGNARVSLARASQSAVRAAREAYRDAVRQSISLTDHSLADLAALDHPYARRHGSIQAGRLGHTTLGGRINDSASLVHSQSGRLVRSLRGVFRASGKKTAYDVWLDAPHAQDVILGTRRMLPRDPLWETAVAPLTIRDMRLAIVRELGLVLRAQATVRFIP